MDDMSTCVFWKRPMGGGIVWSDPTVVSIYARSAVFSFLDISVLSFGSY